MRKHIILRRWEYALLLAFVIASSLLSAGLAYKLHDAYDHEAELVDGWRDCIDHLIGPPERR